MNQSLSISKTGLHAFQYQMDTLAHDIANVNTTAYKAKETSFNELMTNTYVNNNRLLLGDNVELSIQAGTRSHDYTTNFSQGSLVESPGEMQFAISGEGYFQITGKDGRTYYTRDGNFHQDEEGIVKNAHDEVVLMNRDIPAVFNSSEGTLMFAKGENQYTAQGPMEPSRSEVLIGYLEASNINLADAFSQMIIAQRAYGMNLKAAQSTDEIMSLINQFKQ